MAVSFIPFTMLSVTSMLSYKPIASGLFHAAILAGTLGICLVAFVVKTFINSIISETHKSNRIFNIAKYFAEKATYLSTPLVIPKDKSITRIIYINKKHYKNNFNLSLFNQYEEQLKFQVNLT